MDITVYVTSQLTSSERRISVQWSLEYFKKKLQPITGIEPQYQELYLYPISHSNERIELKSTNDSMTLLQKFDIKDFMRIHVKDTNPNSKLEELNTENNDEEDYKFKLSEESYAKRSDSVMNWKRQNQLGRFDPNFEIKRQEQRRNMDAKIETLSVGQRCKIINDTRIGTIRYIGKVPEIDNAVWCGIEFDEPLGKNDGSIKGTRYFSCQMKYGSFINPMLIEIGEFPLQDIFLELEDSDDEI